MASITRFLTCQNTQNQSLTPASSSAASTPVPLSSPSVSTALVATHAANPLHCAVFAIKWDKFWKEGNRPEMQGRIRNKRSLGVVPAVCPLWADTSGTRLICMLGLHRLVRPLASYIYSYSAYSCATCSPHILGNGVSCVYQQGAELEDQEDKYRLCQRCLEKGVYRNWLFVGDLTSSIMDHLRIVYNIQKAGSKQAVTRLESSA